MDLFSARGSFSGTISFVYFCCLSFIVYMFLILVKGIDSNRLVDLV